MQVPDFDIKDVLASCYNDTRLAAKMFLPDRFWRPFDDNMHGKIFDLLDNSDNRLKVVAAPRGIGKTSIINLLLPLKAILYMDYNYIVPVSATSQLAVQQAENLKYELVNNPLVNSLYGPLASNNFNKQQWVVNIGGDQICVMPRGARQQIRGLLFRNHRPGLILVDDLEVPENMDSEEQRQKKKEWFFADLMNCVDRGLGSDWQIIVLGTVLHQDSLLVNLLENKDWDSIVLEICDDDLKSNAPSFMPDREVIKLYEKYKNAGELDVFYREYRNNPVPTGADATFPATLFKNYDPGKINLSMAQDVENLVLVDPAKTANPRSAHSAIVGVGVNVRTNAIYVRDIVSGKLHPNELYQEIVDMIARINARVLGLEVTSLHEFIVYPLKNELRRRNIACEIIELHARGGANEKGKIARIKQLAPLYRQGLIYHNPQCSKVLEGQLLGFPRARRWDVMDAFGYLPEILEIGQRYMMPADDGWETKEQVEREYAELEIDGQLFQFEPLDNFRAV